MGGWDGGRVRGWVGGCVGRRWKGGWVAHSAARGLEILAQGQG